MSDATDELLLKETRAKLAAETRQADANAEQAIASAEQARALAAKYAADARKSDADAKYSELTALQMAIAVRELEREERTFAAKDDRHHVYQFDGPVSAASVKACITKLTEWDRMDPDCPVTVVFNSPGGEVISGMALWDHLMTMKAKHHVTTVTRGLAASMASILFQAGHERVMGSESYQLVHEVSFGAHGKPGDVEDTMDWINKITKRVLRIYAERSTLTAGQIATKWKRKDWTLDADECVKLGFADRIG